MADEPALVDFATAFAAIKEGKAMRRHGWMRDAIYWYLSPSHEGSDPMVVLVDGNKQLGSATVLVTDLLQTDWIIQDIPVSQP